MFFACFEPNVTGQPLECGVGVSDVNREFEVPTSKVFPLLKSPVLSIGHTNLCTTCANRRSYYPLPAAARRNANCPGVNAGARYCTIALWRLCAAHAANTDSCSFLPCDGPDKPK
jgi:hypothetical protein